MSPRALVIGGGIFGVTAALELQLRGCSVTLVDPGPLPHPLAESTDISKVIRLDYGNDVEYTVLGERALDGWYRWNRDWPTPRYHETGVAFLSRTTMQPGGFEHDSYHLLVSRGHHLERLDAAEIARRFPAYRPGVHVDGYYARQGGWAEASAVVMQLVAEAQRHGVAIRGDTPVERLTEHGAIVAGEAVLADHVVVCAGAWVPLLVPALAPSLHAIGQPVFHLAPADPAPFEAARFPVFGADISRTGYYGFPANRDGLVKIANHGAGVSLSPDAPRAVTAAHEADLRAFLSDAFPLLADAPIVARRLCVYCDTADEHFWIARDPDRPHLTVATGGSGHAFKFAPVLGALIANAVLDEPDPLAGKFRWRPELVGESAGDAARAH